MRALAEQHQHGAVPRVRRRLTGQAVDRAGQRRTVDPAHQGMQPGRQHLVVDEPAPAGISIGRCDQRPRLTGRRADPDALLDRRDRADRLHHPPSVRPTIDSRCSRSGPTTRAAAATGSVVPIP